jgi:hypothetical protein
VIKPYDLRQDGSVPSERTLRLLTSPGALRARAAIRAEIARQDEAHGDTWANWRNLHVAADMLERAAKGGAE